MIAVSGVLLLIIMSGRFVKYLAESAAGKLAPDVLFAIMGYRMPGFLELVLPLGLFIAILLAYGRLYMDSEMTVLSACGMSQKRLLGYTMIPSVFVAVVVAFLSLLISPLGAERSGDLLSTQKARSEFDHLPAARFQPLQSGNGVIYSHVISEDRKQLSSVFLAEMAKKPEGASVREGEAQQAQLSVILAESGEQIVDPDNGHRYMLLRNGYRYSGLPGELEYQEIKFDTYAQYLSPGSTLGSGDIKSDALSTKALMDSSASEDQATLHWRLSIPILVLVVSILAVPLSHTNPRQGRYAQMIPAILIYIVYLVSLNAGRGAIEDGKSVGLFGIWGVHLVFLFLAVLLLSKDALRQKLRASSQVRGLQLGGH